MKNTPNKASEFAYQVRRALDEQTAALSANTVHRLTAARQLAISRKKAEAPVYVTAPRLAGIPSHHPFNWLLRVGIMTPLLALVLGFAGIYYYEQQRHIDELAELDAAVLADELPIDAYLDNGFESYLKEHGE
jgi:hypothetical protein